MSAVRAPFLLIFAASEGGRRAAVEGGSRPRRGVPRGYPEGGGRVDNPRARSRPRRGVPRGYSEGDVRGRVPAQVGELRRHAPSLDVAEYPGVQALQKAARHARRVLASKRRRGDDARRENAARALADALDRLSGARLRTAEICLATFGALRKDQHHAPETAIPAGAPASPLMTTTWWRVCVDEAQVVRGGATAAATVARRLRGKRRWRGDRAEARRDQDRSERKLEETKTV